MTKEQFGEQVLAAEKSLYYVAKSILHNDEDCVDAMQNAILTAYSSLEEVRDWTLDWLSHSDVEVHVAKGDDSTRWTKRVTELRDGALSVGYVYGRLSDAFADCGVALDLSYIENTYSELWGDKACQFYYLTEDESMLRNAVYFCGYKNDRAQYVFIQYEYTPDAENGDEYLLAGEYEGSGYYTTADGVTLALTMRQSEGGYAITYAKLLTEHGKLFVTLRGDFSGEERDAIFESMKLAGICVE